MCIDFRKLNDLQPEVHRADSETGGNISLVPLPKIDEMYGRLKGAKYFTTLDLQSGYYHIGLSEGSKAKTAFVTPFGKYQFEVVPFGLAQAPAYFQQLISMVLQDCVVSSQWCIWMTSSSLPEMSMNTLNTYKLYFRN